tara:strand:+ start:8016 stop:8900 length:885 start_codon:yes stop_codon:yes gene_type:complete
MITKGIYSATCSILNDDFSLNVDETISHAATTIKSGLHGVIFFGSTGQSQLLDLNSKKLLISKIAHHKLKKHFFIGTGCNSLNDTVNLLKYSYEYGFNDFLIMPPAYYKNNTEKGVLNFYKYIITKIPKIRIILYNFEKLSSFLFTLKFIEELNAKFPKNIIGVKDSSYNLYENLKIKNFLVFPGSEAKLLKGLELGCAGIISATTQVTSSLARKVFDNYEKKEKQLHNEKLIMVRKIFDNYNLISALHSYFQEKNNNFKNLIPPLELLDSEKIKNLLSELNKIKFEINKDLAA